MYPRIRERVLSKDGWDLVQVGEPLAPGTALSLVTYFHVEAVETDIGRLDLETYCGSFFPSWKPKH